MSASASPSPRPRSLARLIGASLVFALLAAALAALLVAWLPVAAWSGPLAAALLGAVAGPLWVLRGARPLPVPTPSLESGNGLYDEETGAFRRAPFLVLSEREWTRAARYGGAVALLVIEVDRLRAMTDRSGPHVADPLLSGLVQQIRKGLRGADILARYDPAQLAVFLPEADPTGALDVADRIRESVEKLKMPELPGDAQLTASVGVALLKPQHHAWTTLLTDAEEALASARRAGGNCVRMAPQDRRRPARTGPKPGGKEARRSGE